MYVNKVAGKLGQKSGAAFSIIEKSAMRIAVKLFPFRSSPDFAWFPFLLGLANLREIGRICRGRFSRTHSKLAFGSSIDDRLISVDSELRDFRALGPRTPTLVRSRRPGR